LPFSVDVVLVYGFGHDTRRQDQVIENGLFALVGQDGVGNMKNGVHIVSSLADSTAGRMKTTNERGSVDNGAKRYGEFRAPPIKRKVLTCIDCYSPGESAHIDKKRAAIHQRVKTAD